ncbi:MAG: DNA mismatch repair protein MutS [Pseudomonadota bacterium]
MTSSAAVTPMMAQFLEIKAQHADALLFYRMGDFYELFFEDAELAAAALDIALTKRGKHLGKDIPMCGVPIHAADGYLLTLIRKGFRVAVAEQTEDPAEAKKRGAKSVVRREVVRLVTPGTLTEEALLEARRHNFLAAWAELRGEGALAWADVSTGELSVTPVARPALGALLARVQPRELLVPETALGDPGLAAVVEDQGGTVTPLAGPRFDSAAAEDRLKALYRVASLGAYGSFTRPELSVLGALAGYLEITQKGRLPMMRPPLREPEGTVLRIDAATKRNLELTRALSGGREGSLIAAIDRTLTSAGARLLEQRISAPLTDVAAIQARQQAIAWLVDAPQIRRDLRERLGTVPEIERALSRLALDRGGPRDLAAIRNGLAAAAALAALIATDDFPAAITVMAEGLAGHGALVEALERALVAEPPHLTRDGGFIAPGHDPELDAARKLRDEGRGVVAGMQADYVAETGIDNLKIKHNNMLGYFVETTARHADRLMAPPLSERFYHRQTLANQMRFGTSELAELENRILNAGAQALALEKAQFEALREQVLATQAAIAVTARALAELDLAAAGAILAAEEDWCRPTVDASRAFAITAGRHPVVEHALRRQGQGPFVPNDCDLSAEAAGSAPIWLMTGPNMAGKSTFLRQNALIAILAQAGLFVPASAAHLGVIDQLFSRVGAADDLARGQSTFMVEMVETAGILNQAGPRALVILDEIGRGTATYDGLSIAWAALEHLYEVNRCRGLFATHYHELTALAEQLTGLATATVAVREWEGEVIFLHQVRQGVAESSYGIQVGKLAGLPEAVVARAREVLERLETQDREGARGDLIDALPLFQARPNPAPKVTGPHPLETKLAEVTPDLLSPREALDLVYLLCELARQVRD